MITNLSLCCPVDPYYSLKHSQHLRNHLPHSQHRRHYCYVFFHCNFFFFLEMVQKKLRIPVECPVCFSRFYSGLNLSQLFTARHRVHESGRIINTFLAVHIVWYFAVQHGIITQHYQSVSVQRNGRKEDEILEEGGQFASLKFV